MWIRRLTRSLLMALACVPIAAFAADPDWGMVQRDAVAMLTDLIRLDTSQPEGNELIAARYLRDRLARAGIPAEIFESAPGRANVVARLRGNGNRKPLLLLGHLDVVPAEREDWSVDPYAALIRGGRIYGRGAQDDKDIVAAAFTLLIHLAKSGIPLDRDVIVMGVADEETGGELGIDFMLANHRDRIDAEFAINEGGRGEIDAKSGRYVSFNIGTAEKMPRRARIAVHGMPGHGSVPTPDNPILVLAEAITRICEHPFPVRLNATTRTFFERLAAASSGEEGTVYRELLQPDPPADLGTRLARLNPVYDSMVRTSVVPTMIEGGYQQNVIPSRAQAILDIRTLPDEDPEQMFEALRIIAAAPAVEITPLAVTRPAHAPSPLDSELYRTLEAVLRERHPDALILPTMNTGASDSAQLRAAGIATYGFGPGVEQGHGRGVHGNDESLHLGAYHEYLRILWSVVTCVAGAEGAGSE